MTDPMTIAIATAAAGKAVELTGEPLRNAAVALARLVRDRFRGRPEDEQALERAADAHDSPSRLEALEAALRRVMDDDPSFREQVETLWSQTQTNATAQDDAVVNIFNGNAQKVVQLRDHHGDLHL
jgi:hypothetical protein